MKERYSLPPVYIHLRKEIPMGAGMGGGSADAAYVLKGLNDLFELAVSDEELEHMAGLLGSDCPFFIKAEPQIAKGRGEILTSCALTLNGYFLKIVNPGIHIGTREAYAGIQFGELTKSIKEIVEGPITDWKDELKNDFETHIFKMHPSLLTLKNQLYNEGAVYAAMSGSGSTMFGIFKDEPSLTFSSTEGFVEKVVRLN
jgi:4-diphosphocytidyl-2-C-methyl-D-erythritol kinase